MSSHAAKPTAPRDIVAAAVLLAIIALLAFVAAEGLIVLIAAGLGILLIPAASYLLLAYFALLLGASFYMNEIPIQIVGFNWYGSDIFLYFFGAAVVYVAIRKVETAQRQANTYPRDFVVRSEFALVTYGIVALLLGLFVHDYGANLVFGDFRRLFFYSLALLVPLGLPFARRHLRVMPLVVWIAFLGTLAMGLFRFVTGESYREMQYVVMASTPTPRLLSYIESISFCTALAYFTAQSRLSRNPIQKLVGLAAAVVCVTFLFISGWRLAVVLALAIPIAVLLTITWIRREPFRGIIVTAILVSVLAALAVGFMVFVFPEVVEQNTNRLVERFRSFEITTDMRYYVWGEALRQFAEHPIFGVGLGHQLTYAHLASDGLFQVRESSTHNTFLAVLYQTGVVGIFLFLVLHAGFVLRALRNLRAIDTAIVPVLLGLLCLYGTSMLFSAMQPLFPAAIVALYLSMGLVMRTIQLTSDTAS